VWVFKGEIIPGQEPAALNSRAALSNADASNLKTAQMKNDTKVMLSPRRTNPQTTARMRLATKGSNLNFGEFGLQAQEPAWITARQIEASRRAMTRYIRRGGKIWIRIFPINL